QAPRQLSAPFGEARKDFAAEIVILFELLPRGLAERAQHQVLLDRQLREEAAAFRHERDPEIDDLLRALADELVLHAVDFQRDAALARPENPHDAFHERALAVAVRAEQHHGLA